jgi:hypothetical protein
MGWACGYVREDKEWSQNFCVEKPICMNEQIKTKLRGLSPQANYTDPATAACRRT